MLELHCHTTFSDGTLTPRQLVEAAVATGVRALAITDHDTLAGWDEACKVASAYNLEIVPGVELSTVYNERSLHILGFYPDKDKLELPLRDRVEGRKRRAQQMVAKLAALGYPIELPELGEGVAPARPHIAQALVKAGYVQSSHEAFARWLGDNGPAYVRYEKFSATEGIELLRNCGAVPVWAHPYLFQGGKIETVLKELVDAGLMGLEAYHPSQKRSEQKHLQQLATEYNLIITGGSDYHGPSPGGKQAEATTLNQLQLSLDLLQPVLEAKQALSNECRSSIYDPKRGQRTPEF